MDMLVGIQSHEDDGTKHPQRVLDGSVIKATVIPVRRDALSHLNAGSCTSHS